jgi:hypothetical protein
LILVMLLSVATAASAESTRDRVAGSEVSALSRPTGVSGVRSVVPDWMVYRFYFAHVANLERLASREDTLGNHEQAESWRTHELRAIGLSPREMDAVKEIAAECNEAIRQHDALATSARGTTTGPLTSMTVQTSVDEAPLAPERSSIVESHITRLRTRMGDEAAARLRRYLQETFEPNARLDQRPIPLASGPAVTQDSPYVAVATFTTIEGAQGFAECDTEMDEGFNSTAANYLGVSANCGIYHYESGSFLGTFVCPGPSLSVLGNPSALCGNDNDHSFGVSAGDSYRTDADHYLTFRQTTQCSDPVLGNGFFDPFNFGNIFETFTGSGTVYAPGGATSPCVHGSAQSRIASTYGVPVTASGISVSPQGPEVLPGQTQVLTATVNPPTGSQLLWFIDSQVGTSRIVPLSGPSTTFIAPTNEELRSASIPGALFTVRACTDGTQTHCGATRITVPRVEISAAVVAPGTNPFVATAAAGVPLRATVTGPTESAPDVKWPSATTPAVGNLQDFGQNSARYTAPTPAVTDVTKLTVQDLCLRQFPTICQDPSTYLQLELVPPVVITNVTSDKSGIFIAGYEVPSYILMTINGSGFGDAPLVTLLGGQPMSFTPTSITKTQIVGQLSIQSTARGTFQVRVTTITDGFTTTATSNQINIAAATFSVVIDPKTASVREGETQKYTASVLCRRADATLCSVWQGVGWGTTAGTVDGSGLFTAPHTGTIPPSATITACASASSSTCANANATLVPISVSLTPSAPSVDSCAQQQFTAAVANTSQTGVTWLVTGGGSITQQGLYSAPCPVAARSTAMVKACSALDPGRCGTANVTLIPVWTLTVASFAPTSGVTITVVPNDKNGNGSAATQFQRLYRDQASVSLTAPPSAGINAFDYWWGCGSTSGTACNVTMTQNKTVTVNYLPPRAQVIAIPPRVIGPKVISATVNLSAAAPAGGASVTLTSSDPVATVPGSIAVPAGATSATFNVNVSATPTTKDVTLSALYSLGGPPATATLKVDAPLVITSFTPNATTILAGTPFSITLNATGSAAPLQWAPFRLLSGTSTWIPSAAAPYSGVVYQANGTTWTWTPTLADVGTWSIAAWVRGSDSSRWGTWGNAETGTMGTGQPVNLTITVTAPPIFEGYFDNLDCNNISGWAWDRNKPNTSINVDIVADGVPIVYGVPASIYRPDLVTAGKGNGVHGFGYPYPASLRDGRPHSIAVYYSGSVPPTQLGWSPKSITCQSTIQVTSATYGANCGAPAGNATSSVGSSCNGQASCAYTVRYQTLGDPAPGCAKDFRTSWTCSGGTNPPALTLPAEAGLGSVANLRCP